MRTHPNLPVSYRIFERTMRITLPFFFGIVFYHTMLGAKVGYMQHNPWKIGDWLINFQGGFIRRGLFGEIVYQLSLVTHISPGIYTYLFQIFCFGMFFLTSYLLLRKQENILCYAFLVFSPFLFTFQLNDPPGGYRKEIIYFMILALVALCATAQNKARFEKVFWLFLLSYPAAILTHEMLAIFLPYILVAYCIAIPLSRSRLFLLTVFTIPSVISFLLAVYYHGSTIHVEKIYSSLVQINYPITGGAIEWMDKDMAYGAHQVAWRIHSERYYYYIALLGLATAAFLPLRSRLQVIFSEKFNVFLIATSVLGSVSLFWVAVDWGRFILVHLVSLFLLTLIPPHKNKSYPVQPKTPVGITMVFLFLIYALAWHIPNSGPPVHGFGYNYLF